MGGGAVSSAQQRPTRRPTQPRRGAGAGRGACACTARRVRSAARRAHRAQRRSEHAGVQRPQPAAAARKQLGQDGARGAAARLAPHFQRVQRVQHDHLRHLAERAAERLHGGARQQRPPRVLAAQAAAGGGRRAPRRAPLRHQRRGAGHAHGACGRRSDAARGQLGRGAEAGGAGRRAAQRRLHPSRVASPLLLLRQRRLACETAVERRWDGWRRRRRAAAGQR